MTRKADVLIKGLLAGFGAVFTTVLILLITVSTADAASATIVVDSVADAADADTTDNTCATATGACTLRAAIETANTRPGSDVIHFGIPGAGPHTIAITSDLPDIYDGSGWLTIDGYTQPGATPNTAAVGSNADLRIQLQKAAGSTASYGLRIASAENTVRGLAIGGFVYNLAIHFEQADGNTIVGNFIGLDAAGESVGGSYGVWIWLGPDRNVIGTPDLADRNVFFGNTGKSLQIEQGTTSRNVIQNNVIGLNPNLTEGTGRGYGFDIQWGTWGNLIGGHNPGEGNLIAGKTIGIDFSHSSADNIVLGNYFGTLGDGNSAAPHTALAYGILLKDDSHGHHIANNVIGNTTNWGIWSRHNYNGGTTVVNNRLGVGSNGAPLPAKGSAFQVNGHDDLIQDNIIANHEGGAVTVVDITYTDRHTNFPPEQTLGNRILYNTFHGNTARSWQQIPGGLANVSVGVDKANWGVNRGGHVYRRAANGGWQHITPGMSQIDAYDYNTAVAVNASNEVYRYRNGTWTQITGVALKHVSIGTDQSIWGIGTDDRVYRRTANATAWEAMDPARLMQVDVYDYDTAVGVNAANSIWQYDAGVWTQISGGLRHVSFGVDQSMWGVNANDNVYRRSFTSSWQLISGEMVQIDAYDYENATAVDSADQIFLNTVGVGLPIDIEPLGGLNVDDAGDADDGAHRLLNRPVFTGAGSGQVYGTACPGCEVHVYLSGSIAADGTVNLASTAGDQGWAWAGASVANGSGVFSLGDQRMAVGRQVWALAIDPEGNTSESTAPLTIPATPFGIQGNPSTSIARSAAPATPTLPDAHVPTLPTPFACSHVNGVLSWADAGAAEYYVFGTTNGVDTYLGAKTGTSSAVADATTYRVSHWRYGRGITATCDFGGSLTFLCSVAAGVLSWTDAGAGQYYVFATTNGVERYLGGHAGTTLSVQAADSYRVEHWLTGAAANGSCEGAGPVAFTCSVAAGVLSWADAGAGQYYVFATANGVERYLGGHAGTTLNVQAADSYRVEHWLTGAATNTTCEGAGPVAFLCSVAGGVLSWSDAGAAEYYVFATTNGAVQYLGGHAGTTLSVQAADSYRVEHWLAGPATNAIC